MRVNKHAVGVICVASFSALILLSMAATTSSYRSTPPPTPQPPKYGTKVSESGGPLTLPALIIALQCDCTTFDPAALKTWTANQMMWVLDSKSQLRRVSDDLTIDGTDLAQELRPNLNPQLFALDRGGILIDHQVEDLKPKEFAALAAKMIRRIK